MIINNKIMDNGNYNRGGSGISSYTISNIQYIINLVLLLYRRRKEVKLKCGKEDRNRHGGVTTGGGFHCVVTLTKDTVT